MKKSTLIKKLLIIHLLLIAAVILFIGGRKLLLISQPNYYAGKIFNQKISSNEFKETYDRILIQTRFQYGEMFETLEPLLDLEEQTWESLIILKEAKTRKIHVTKKEIIDEIAKFKVFYRNNKFDTLLYKNILRKAFNTQVSIFEDSIRDMLIKQKLHENITDSISLNDEDVLNEYKNRNEKLQLSYLLIALDKFKEKTSINNEEIESYYSKHKKDFLIPKTIKVGHIHLDFPEDGGVQKQVEMKYKAKAILDDYKKTKDLKLSAQKIGFNLNETDFFKKTDLNVDIGLTFTDLNKLFKAEKGKILEPFQTEKGYIIVKIVEKRNPHIGDFAEVKDTIKEILNNNKAREMAINEATKIQKQIINEWGTIPEQEKDFSKILATLNFESIRSPLLSKDQISYNLGLINDFEINAEKIFSLTKNKPISEVIPTEKGACIFHLDIFENYNEDKFKEETKVFTATLLNQKKEKTFASFIKDLREKANLIYY